MFSHVSGHVTSNQSRDIQARWLNVIYTATFADDRVAATPDADLPLALGSDTAVMKALAGVLNLANHLGQFVVCVTRQLKQSKLVFVN